MDKSVVRRFATQPLRNWLAQVLFYVLVIYVGVGLTPVYTNFMVCVVTNWVFLVTITASTAATARRTQVGLSHVPAGLRGVRVTLQQQDARAQDFVLQISSIGFSHDLICSLAMDEYIRNLLLTGMTGIIE